MNVKDHGALGDNATDDTAAFVSALASIDSKVMSVGGRTMTRPGGVLDVPSGSYRIHADLLLHRRLRLRLEPDATLLFGSVDANGFVLTRGGLVLDSQRRTPQGVPVPDAYDQSESGVEVIGGNVASLYGGVGFHARGGGYSEVRGVTFTGWDECAILDGSNGIVIRGGTCSTWPGEGAQFGNGVRFALRPQGGGGTNGCGVEGMQFNGCGVGVSVDDGAGCYVRDSNFNAPGEVLRVTGAISFTMENCVGEGVVGNCYIRLGKPGGSSVERIVAQSLRVQGVWSRNEATATKPAPSIVRIEQNTQAWNVDLRGTHILAGGFADPVIACAEPWPAIPYVKFRTIDRRGVTVNGSTIAAWRRYGGQPTGPVMSDRDLGGIDYGA